MPAEVELLMCTAVKTVSSGHLKGQDRLSTLEGVHFGEGFQEMSLKWRETHKRSRAWKQKHSTYHEHDQPVEFEVIWITN